MARTNHPNATDGQKPAGPMPASGGGDQTTGVLEHEPLRATIDAAFLGSEVMTDAFTTNLKHRTADGEAIARRVNAAFAKFTPSSYSKEDRDRPTYLAPQDDLSDLLERTARAGVAALQGAKDGQRHGIRLARGDELDKLIKKAPDGDGSSLGTIKLNDLVTYITQRLVGGSSPLSSLRVRDAEEEAERRLTEIENRLDVADGIPIGAVSNPTDWQPDAHASRDGEGSADALVTSSVDRLMSSMRSPEARFPSDPPQRADGQAIAKSIDTFELRSGPSDVTSYHDFNSLQIAFPNVWTEVFDGQLEPLGKKLYDEYVRLKVFAGLDDGDDDTISTVADLSRLIGDMQSLSQLTQNSIPPTTLPPKDGSQDPAGRHDLFNDIAQTFKDAVESREFQWIVNPLGAGLGFLSSLLANMQQITWRFLEEQTVLPGGIDKISATIQENAVPAGFVEITLANLPETATWKGIDFYELDRDGRPVSVVKITNHPNDQHTMALRTQQVKNGMLAFGKELEFQAHKAQYFLVGLDERLKDRSRVTFTWTKDK